MNRFFILLISFLILVQYSNAQQAAPALEWQKCFGGTGEDKLTSIVRTPDNGFIMVGYSKSNDGDVSGHHGSLTVSDAWIVKLSEAGNIEWQRSLGGSGADVFNSVTLLKDGSYLCKGTTSSSDGDVSGFHTSPNQDNDIWLVKIDRHGNIVWQKCLGGSKIEIAGSVKEASDRNLYLIGSTTSTDGDVVGNVQTASCIWIVKLTTDGAIVWQKSFGGGGPSKGYDIEPYDDGSFLIVADPGNITGFGTFQGESPRSYAIKIDSSFQMVSKLYISQRTTPRFMLKGNNNEFYVSSQTISCYPENPSSGLVTSKLTTNSSPGNQPPTIISNTGLVNFNLCVTCCSFIYSGYPIESFTNNLTLLNSNDQVVVGATDDSLHITGIRKRLYGFMAGYKSNGSLSWRKTLGGSQATYFASVATISETEFMVCGYTSANDGDVSGNHGGVDGWVVKMGQVNSIKGTVYADYNLNGYKDADEPFVNGVLVESAKSGVKYASTSIDGYFRNAVDTGTYTTLIISPLQYYTVAPAFLNSSFSAYNTVDSLSFSLKPIGGKRDYKVEIYTGGAIRPGFKTWTYLRYSNEGTDTLKNGQLKVIKDPRLVFDSASPAENNISGDTIIWNVPILAPREKKVIAIYMKAPPPPAINIGDTVQLKAMVDSTGDLRPTDNISIMRQGVMGSFDPNDKRENLGGVLGSADLASSRGINYTIRFQNTGNDTAFNVSVKDSLDDKLDWSSIEVLGASHPYELTVKDGNKVTWNFHNILLVDSIHNEPLSHGYISYSIKPKASLAPGDAIKNAADIYFDFNPAVKTNTTITVIKVLSPDQPLTSGLKDTYCSSSVPQTIKILNLPSADFAATVEVKLDATILPVAADGTFILNPAVLSIGSHSLGITYSNSAGAKTTSQTFIVKPMVTPDVNVSANITTVVNLTDAVIVTADNVSGGGTTPLYTFAKDRAITNILQTESSNNKLNVIPGNLIIGDNWIYARMRTSDTCYTTATNIDSIKIIRSAVTGLTDIDNPAQVINIYPNPFKQGLLINGLNSAKQYSVYITNIAGQQLYHKQITNSSSLSISKPGLQTGTYWLSIYDDKKKRLIGTVPVVKE